MKYLDKNSLAKTIDNVSEALLFNLDINDKEKREVADFIVYQHSQPHLYADTFAPTDFDLKRDLILFTGEKIKTGAGKCHMIGEEASRILRKLDLQIEKVKIALQEADKGLQNRITISLNKPRYIKGKYCCKSCSCALWINLTSGGLNNDTKLLISGLDYLKQHRDEKGSWKGFPYFYTLFVLNEINPDLAMDEMRYIAKSIERRLKRNQIGEDKYEMRRNYISEKILNKVNSN